MRIRYWAMAAIAVVLFTACEPAANTNTASNANSGNAANANSNANANRAAAAPTRDELMTLERSAYEAFRTKNKGFWDGFLSSNFTGYGMNGRLDRAAALKEFASDDCDVNSITLTDDQMTQIAPDVAAVSYKVAMDGTCGGQKMPANLWGGGLYVRENGQWKGAFHGEAPAMDPQASTPPAKPVQQPASGANSSDPTTSAIVAAETKLWEAWKNKDGAALESALGKDFTYTFFLGRFNRGDMIRLWSTDNKCDVKSYSLSDAKTTPLANNVTLLTYKGSAVGTCEGQPIPTEWYGAAYANDAGSWKPVWSLSVPAS